MIDLGKVRNYYIACGYTDLRLGIDGLAAVVTQQFGGHLDEESLFLFCGRRTDRIKALYWCGDGYILLYKRLSNGRFQWPRSEVELRLLDACDKCEKDTGFAHIIITKTPPPLMKHSLASPSTVADVMTKKYVDGVPLARQEKIWARQGVELSRATLANWVIQCTQTWLKPLYKHMKQQLLAQPVIHADETVVQVLKEDNKSATSESRMWLYASGEYSKNHIHQPDRSGKRPESSLKGFTGCLVTDGYAGYNQVQKVIHCGCWAHARRKWRKAMPDGATVKTSKAAVGFQYCMKLFSLEKKYIYADGESRKAYRQNVVKLSQDIAAADDNVILILTS